MRKHDRPKWFHERGVKLIDNVVFGVAPWVIKHVCRFHSSENLPGYCCNGVVLKRMDVNGFYQNPARYTGKIESLEMTDNVLYDSFVSVIKLLLQAGISLGIEGPA